MAKKKRSFKIGEDIVDIPVAEVDAFMKDVPDAIEVESYTIGEDTVDIPLNELEQFRAEVPDAKPLFAEETVVTEGQKKSPSGTAPEVTAGSGQPPAGVETDWLTNVKRNVNYLGQGIQEAAGVVGSAYPVAKGWLESIFESDKTESGKKADKAAGIDASSLKVTEKGKPVIVGVSEIDRNVIMKNVADMPERLRESKDARRVWIKTYSQKTGIDKRAVEQLYDQASNARKAIDQLEMEYYGEGTPITPEGKVTAPPQQMEGQGQMKKFAKLYELARMYNYVGDHERAERAYSELERGLYAYGSTQMRNEDFSSRAPKDYVEQLQAPATQGLAYTKYLKGDKKGAEKITNILKVKGLVEPETELAQVGTGDIMQETPSVRSTYGFTGKRGYKLEDGEWVQESTPTPESEYLNSIAESIEQYSLIGPMSEIPMRATEKIGKAIKGRAEAQIIAMGGDFSGAVIKELESDLALLTGIVEGAAGVAGMTTPVGAVFALPFFQASNMLPPQVSEWMMPVSNAVRKYYAEKGEEAPEWTENIAVLTDFALLALAHQGIVKGAKYGKARKQARTMNEFLDDLSPEAKEAAFSDIEKNWKASGEDPVIYAEKVKEKVETVKDQAEKLQDDIKANQPVEEYQPAETPESLSRIPEGTEVEYMGEVGKIERGEDMSWNVVFEDGRTVELPVKDKVNAVESPADLGVSILPEVPQEKIARAMADAEQVSRQPFEYKGKKYFISLDRTGNPTPNGDFVLELMPDGRMVDRFSSHRDRNFAAERKLAITNAFLESKGLPKRTKNIEPWKEAERYEVEDGSIAYEPETPNAFGGKGQYVFYDNAGNARVITQQEYLTRKQYGSPVKTKPYEGKTEAIQGSEQPVSGEPAEQGGARPATANAAKRTEIRQGLIDARNKGILVSVDKGIIATTKRALGIETKKVPMSDMEIDAVMELTDAMAGVWKEATGKDNFYEAFISELVPVEKADTQMYLQNLKEAGGVLFQDVSNPVNVQSRVTLAVLETPQFKGFEGKQVNPQQIGELIKSRGKQIEKDIINYVLSQDKYRGQKRIDYNEFRSDVDMQVMKLERKRTSSHSDYGMDNMGDNEYYGEHETVILNSPLDHGQVGHFPRDFKVDTGVKTEWEIIQIGDSNTYVALDKNRPSNLTSTTLQNYIGTSGSKANVERWVNQRNAGANAPVNKGMFGHFRAWFDKAKGIFHLAEAQSDYFQNHKASEQIMELLVPEEEIEFYLDSKKGEFEKQAIKELDDLGYLKREITDESIVFKDESGNIFHEQSFETSPESPYSNLTDREWAIMKATSIAYQRYASGYYKVNTIDATSATPTYYQLEFSYRIAGKDRSIIIDEFTDINKASEAFENYGGEHQLREQKIDDIEIGWRRERKRIDTEERKLYIEKRGKELESTIAEDINLKQFIASQKIHEQRILREALQDAAERGATTLRFPTPKTLALIQYYIKSERAPYEIISGDATRLDVGDVIEMGGDQYYVLEADSRNITVAPTDRVYVYERDAWIADQTNSRLDDLSFNLKRHVEDYDAIRREEVETWDTEGEYYGDEVKQAILEQFEGLEEGKTLSWSELWSDAHDAVYNEVSKADFYDEILSFSAEVYADTYGDVAYAVERRGITDSLKQPDEYDFGDDVNWENNLNSDQQAVVNKYKDLNKEFKKMRGDVVEVTDGNGRTWLETKISEADKNNPIIAFQKSGAKVKGAIDFLNDNKATVSIFDGADVSTLAHEFTGHLGRRFLEKLSETDGQFAKDYEAIKQWAKVKDNMWSARAEEMFARGFERYLRTGKAPTPELTRVFEMMAKWLKGIYKKIEGSEIDIEITPEVRDIFGRLLGGERTEPKVGDTVMIEPVKKGASTRKMVFTEEGWKQEVNGKEVKVGTTVQGMAAEAWKEGPKEEAVPSEAEVPPTEAEPPAPKLKSFEEVGEETINLQGSLGLRGGGLPFQMPKDLWKQIKTGFKKYFTPMGGMPKDIFNREIQRGGSINAAFTEVKFTINDLQRAVKAEFGAAYDKLPFSTIEDMNSYLKGDQTVSLPDPVKIVLNDMRQQIDNLSRQIIKQGLAEGDLAVTITENMGVYLTRSYRKFREPKWAEIVPETIKNQAAAWIRSEYPNLTPDQINGLINHLLYTEGAPMDVIKGSKIGSKNLDILKGRKDIPEALRLLWGEYKDPLVNYMTSIQKMATLVENDKFLNDLFAMGVDKYFFDKPTGDAYVQLAGLGTKGYSPLNGRYTTPALKEALTIVKNNVDKNYVYRAYMALNAYVKLGKTVYSPMTHVRNFISNVAFVVANGHYLYPAKARQTWRTVRALFNNKSDFATLDYIKDLQKKGVIGEALDVGEIRMLLKSATKKYNSFEDFTQQNFLSKFNEKITETYQLEDTVYKVFAFEAEKQRYMDVGFTYKEAVDIAAENVRNTYPNYKMVPKAIKEIGKTPFIGTFVSFPTEVVRTYANTWQLAIKEMKDPRTIRIGISRVAGLMLMTVGVKGVAMALKSEAGVTDEMEKALRRFQPPWTEFSDYMYTGEYENNVPSFIDFGGTDPYSYIKSPVNAMMMNDEPGEAIKDATWAILKPYFSEEILASKLLDVSRNKKDTGGRIYYDTDPMGDKIVKSVAYVSQAAEPGFISQGRKIYKGYKGETGPYDRKYDLQTEILAVTTGQRIVKSDIIASYNTKSSNFSNNWAETSKKYTAAQYQKKSEEEMEETKISATESRRELFEEMKKDYEAARLFGYSSQELKEIMKKNRVPKNVIDAIIYDFPFEKTKPLQEIED